jgi:hypothetical protein
MHAADNRQPPEMDKSACRSVPLARNESPRVFDFFAWLVMAEMVIGREGNGACAGFFWGHDGNMERILQTAGCR